MAELIIEYLFGLSLFINALLFIPQAMRLYRKKDSTGLSFVSFFGFNIIQFLAVLNSLIYKNTVATIGWMCSLVACGSVTLMILIYRKNPR